MASRSGKNANTTLARTVCSFKEFPGIEASKLVIAKSLRSSFEMAFIWRTGMFAAMVVAFAAWGLQLAGIASIQQACEADLGGDVLDKASLNDLHELMNQARATLVQQVTYATIAAKAVAANNTLLAAEAARNQTAAGLQYQKDTLVVLSTLAKRSASAIPPAFTPDHNCSDFYRYGWAATIFQLFTLMLLMGGLITQTLRNLVVSTAVFLGVSMSMAIQNGHTYFYVRHLGDAVPHDTFVRGKVFFAGCVFVVVTDAILLFFLGTYKEVELGPVSRSSSKDDDDVAKHTQV